MKQPFFKKENDQNNLQKLTSLQQQIDQQEAELKKSRANILKYEEEHKELSDEMNGLNKDKQFYNEELKKMNTYNDPHGLTVDQIQSKLQQEDPTMFRQVMKDLSYNGDEPQWEKNDLLDRINGRDLNSADISAVKKEIEKLRNERRILASELQRNQDLLKQQVDIDRENNELVQLEIKQLQA